MLSLKVVGKWMLKYHSSLVYKNLPVTDFVGSNDQ